MKVQQVLLRAVARKITWWQAAEIIGISTRQLRRWRERYEEHGHDGLMDAVPSSKRVPLAQERFLGLYRYKYCDLNVRHSREAASCGPDRIELHIGEAGLTGCRSGEA